MPKSPRWKESSIQDGVGEVHILSWRYYIDYVRQEMLDYENYIWRGQRNSDWELESSLDRLLRKTKIAKTKRAEFRKRHLEQFKYATRGRRGENPSPINKENDWWALGQHHNLWGQTRSIIDRV